MSQYADDILSRPLGQNPLDGNGWQRRRDVATLVSEIISMATPVGDRAWALRVGTHNVHNVFSRLDIPDDATVETLALYHRPADRPNTQIQSAVRMSKTGAVNGYTAGLRNTATDIRGYRFTDGAITDLGVTTHGLASAYNWLWSRVQIEGTTLRHRIWADGTPEPETWNQTFTGLTQYATGGAGIHVYRGQSDAEIYIGYFSVGIAGDPAPEPGELPYQKLRVMCCGDSVTGGSATEAYASTTYRYELFKYWRDNAMVGLTVEAVGPFYGVTHSDLEPTVGWAVWSQLNSRHAGRGGWTIEQIAGAMQSWVSANYPDVILFLGGFNAMGSITTAHVQALIDNARAAKADVRFIIGLPYYGTWNATEDTDSLRAILSAVSAERHTVQSPIKVIDLNEGWVPAVHGGGFDGLQAELYPNQEGAALLAHRWLEALIEEVTVVVDTDPAQTPNYVSLADAVAGETGPLPVAVTSANLALNHQRLTIECRATGGIPDATGCVVSGFTTSKYAYVKIVVPEAHRHNGVWDDTKYRIMPNPQTYSALHIWTDYTQVIGVQADNGLGDANLTTIDIRQGYSHCIVDGCIARSTAVLATNHNIGFLMRGSSLGSVGNVIRNCLAYGFKGGSVLTAAFMAYQPNGDCVFQNCTAHDSRVGLIDAQNQGGRAIAANFLSTGNSVADFSGVDAAASSHNISSDATAPGASSLTNQLAANLYVDAGALNFALKTGSPAIDIGLALDFNTDIIGTARPQGTGWDIGAFEYVASSEDHSGASSVTGVGALSTSGTKAADNSANAEGTGGLSTAVSKAAQGNAAVVGVVAIVATGVKAASAPTASTGIGQETTTGTKAGAGKTSLSAVGAIATDGTAEEVMPTGTAEITATGEIAITGAKYARAPPSAMAGTAGIAAEGVKAATATTAIEGAGAIEAGLAKSAKGQAAIVGIGLISASATTATLSGLIATDITITNDEYDINITCDEYEIKIVA